MAQFNETVVVEDFSDGGSDSTRRHPDAPPTLYPQESIQAAQEDIPELPLQAPRKTLQYGTVAAPISVESSSDPVTTSTTATASIEVVEPNDTVMGLYEAIVAGPA